ncbi:MAG: TerC family protein [Phycisphaerales bacterium]|nr:TerC family protein [Phycisphaerales bacterium]
MLTFALEVGISPWMFVGFVGIVIVLLALDLGVFHRRAHAPRMRESLAWTAFWILLGLAFASVVYWLYQNHVGGLGQHVPIVGRPGQTETVLGGEATKVYITAYLLEKSLSVDNLFVIAMIFASLGIPPAYQHRVLFWGILGALITRGLMICVGSAVVASFAWVVYVFGGLLILSAIKMMVSEPGSGDPREHWAVRLAGRVLPISASIEGQRLLSHEGGRWHGTPLLVALVVIEATDVMFAVDSIPAVFALTGDPFIVFTSNIMAILGLRSLYFCLASAMAHFRFLKGAVITVLLFVGVKMCLVHTDWKVPTEVSMGVIVGLLALGVIASLALPKRNAEPVFPRDQGDPRG